MKVTDNVCSIIEKSIIIIINVMKSIVYDEKWKLILLLLLNESNENVWKWRSIIIQMRILVMILKK